MWVDIDDEWINLDNCSSIVFWAKGGCRGCTLHHGSTYTMISLNVEIDKGNEKQRKKESVYQKIKRYLEEESL